VRAGIYGRWEAGQLGKFPRGGCTCGEAAFGGHDPLGQVGGGRAQVKSQRKAMHACAVASGID
jgi:hypothetical protein